MAAPRMALVLRLALFVQLAEGVNAPLSPKAALPLFSVLKALPLITQLIR